MTGKRPYFISRAKDKVLTVYSLPFSVDDDDIEDQCTALRKKLEREQSTTKSTDARGLKTHQVHELAQAKIEESEKLRRALGISKDYEEGSHWRRQEDRVKENQRRDMEREADRDTKRPDSPSDDYSD